MFMSKYSTTITTLNSLSQEVKN
jgi:amino acid permease